MDNKAAKRATVILGVIMIVAIGSSAILPLFTQNQPLAPTVAPSTPIPSPTFPPPITDFSSLSFDQDYLHPSGLFSVAQPSGWSPNVPVTQTSGVEISFNNPTLLSVIQISLQVAASPVADLDALDALYTSESLNSSWIDTVNPGQSWRNWEETARSRQDDKLIIDFEVENQRQQQFLARQVSWVEDDWVYSIRVVAPENAVDLVRFLSDEMPGHFHPNRQFAGTAPNWSAYFDPASNTVIRFPATWVVTDSAPGRPASIDGEDVSLRIESQAISAPLDEAAARRYVEASGANVTVSSVEAVEQGDLAGFSVAYTYTDADGNPNSGLALLLNGTDGALRVANLRLFEPNVDLNSDAAAESHPDLVNVFKTFFVLSDLSVPLPTPTPTPTLVATATPEATAEATAAAEATAEATVETTPEATAGS